MTMEMDKKNRQEVRPAMSSTGNEGNGDHGSKAPDLKDATLPGHVDRTNASLEHGARGAGHSPGMEALRNQDLFNKNK